MSNLSVNFLAVIFCTRERKLAFQKEENFQSMTSAYSLHIEVEKLTEESKQTKGGDWWRKASQLCVTAFKALSKVININICHFHFRVIF